MNRARTSRRWRSTWVVALLFVACDEHRPEPLLAGPPSAGDDDRERAFPDIAGRTSVWVTGVEGPVGRNPHRPIRVRGTPLDSEEPFAFDPQTGGWRWLSGGSDDGGSAVEFRAPAGAAFRAEATDGALYGSIDLLDPWQVLAAPRVLRIEEPPPARCAVVDEHGAPCVGVAVRIHLRYDNALCGRRPDPVLAEAVTDSDGVADFGVAGVHARSFLRMARRFGGGTVYFARAFPEPTPAAVPYDPLDPATVQLVTRRGGWLTVEVGEEFSGDVEVELDRDRHRPARGFCASPIRVTARVQSGAATFEVAQDEEYVCHVLPDDADWNSSMHWVTGPSAAHPSRRVQVEATPAEGTVVSLRGGVPAPDLPYRSARVHVWQDGRLTELAVVKDPHRRVRLAPDQPLHELWVEQYPGWYVPADGAQWISDLGPDGWRGDGRLLELSKAPVFARVSVVDEHGDPVRSASLRSERGVLISRFPTHGIHVQDPVIHVPDPSIDAVELVIEAPGYFPAGPIGDDAEPGRWKVTVPRTEHFEVRARAAAAVRARLQLPDGVTSHDLSIAVAEDRVDSRIVRRSDDEVWLVSAPGQHAWNVDVRRFPGEPFETLASFDPVMESGVWQPVDVDLRDSGLWASSVRALGPDGEPLRDVVAVAVANEASLGPPVHAFDRTGRWRLTSTIESVELWALAPGMKLQRATLSPSSPPLELRFEHATDNLLLQIQSPSLPVPDDLAIEITAQPDSTQSPALRQLLRTTRWLSAAPDSDGRVHLPLPCAGVYQVEFVLRDRASGRSRSFGEPTTIDSRTTEDVVLLTPDDAALREAVTGR